MSQSAPKRLRRGFTLVEMLVVIMIIAMLMGMTSFAVWKVILGAKQAKIATEIDQLSQAMAGYKQTRIQYPPCMGTINLNNRKMEFLRHISLAFTNANYGTTTTHFNNLSTTVGSYYNYLNGASTATLSLHNLDQAEALVFWLGGFPTPVTSTGGPIANRRLFGFHRDEDNPFQRIVAFEAGAPLQFRTDPLFSFEETRLTDVDNDGWLEYCPLAQRSGEKNAPYVYFDSYTYGGSTNLSGTSWRHYGYPRPDNNGTAAPQASFVAEMFGIASPMASMIDPSKSQTTRWVNSTGIQIICGGLDGMYSTGVPQGATLSDAQRTVTFPQGEAYSGTQFTTVGGLSREDLDNQTNLSNKTIDGARTEAVQ